MTNYEIHEYTMINGKIYDGQGNHIATIEGDSIGHYHAENNQGEIISIHEDTPNAKAAAVCSILSAYL